MPSNPILTSLIGGFVGAAFAFLFVRLNAFLGNLADRKKTHYSVLVRMEYMLNNFLDNCHQHAADLRHLANTYAAVQPPSMAITYCLPQHLDFDDSEVTKLGNIDLVNDFVVFTRKLHRINRDTSAICNAYVAMLDRAMTGDIKPDAYTQICRSNIAPCNEVATFTDQLVSEAITMSARIRVRLKRDRPALHWLGKFSVKKHNEADFSRAVREEVTLLENEIEQESESSKDYIDSVARKIVGKAGQD